MHDRAEVASRIPAWDHGLTVDAQLAREFEERLLESSTLAVRVAFSVLRNREDAEDVAQEAFIKCWRNQDKLPEIDNLKAWIFRIALNTGRDIRETAWRRKKQALPEDEAMLTSTQAGPEELVLEDERLNRLRTAMHQLRPEEQEVFLLRQNGEMTYEEIGEALEIPSGTVKTRMRLALQKLREVLADEP